LARVTRGELAPPSHLRHELLLGHVPLLLSLAVPGRVTLTPLFPACEQLPGAKERTKSDRVARERVCSALLAVDDAHRGRHDEPRMTQRLDRLEQRAPGGDDVLDEADALAVLVRPLEPVAGAVLLRLLAHDEKRQARLERRGGGERDGAQFRRG